MRNLDFPLVQSGFTQAKHQETEPHHYNPPFILFDDAANHMTMSIAFIGYEQYAFVQKSYKYKNKFHIEKETVAKTDVCSRR